MWLITPKQHPRVAVALHLPSKTLSVFIRALSCLFAACHTQLGAVRRLLSSFLIACSCLLFAFQIQAQEHFIGQLHAHSPIELSNLLDRAEHWSENTPNYPENAITIVLHGPEAQAFVKDNYSMYRQLVDKAAKLDAFNVVDIKICETWMGMNQIQRSQLPAFVDTVPFGPAEETKLIKAGYQKF